MNKQQKTLEISIWLQGQLGNVLILQVRNKEVKTNSASSNF